MPVTQKNPAYDFSSLKGKERRRAKDHIELHELCARSDKIAYEVKRRKGDKPPESYLIFYNGIRSIVGIDHLHYPIFGETHIVRIDLPEEYPNAGSMPLCFMETDIWHPNIKSSGPAKGHICINPGKLGAWQDLYMLIIRIGEIIQYKNYLAEQVPPFPEDEVVAQWVRDFAEPKGIVNYQKKIATDDSDLVKPLKGFEARGVTPPANPPHKPAAEHVSPPENQDSKIKISFRSGGVTPPANPPDRPAAEHASPLVNQDSKIKIKINK